MRVENEVMLPGSGDEWVTKVSSGDEDEIDHQDEKEIVERINDQAHLEVLKEIRASDLVARNCVYVRFESESNGRGRPPRKPRLVELYSRKDGRFYSISEDGAYGIDDDASEIFGDTVDGSEAVKTFLERLRNLPNLK